MTTLDKSLVLGTDNDDKYKHGPSIGYGHFLPSQTININITEFITPSLFFGFDVSFCFHREDELNVFYDSVSDFFVFDRPPSVGTVCAVRFSRIRTDQKRWYRARVVRQDRNLVDVFLVDYGNIAKSIDVKVDCRKLESTFSTQFERFGMLPGLNCQAVLFGFVGAICDNVLSRGIEMKRLRELGDKSMQFQIINAPSLRKIVKVENSNNSLRIPFYLIRSSPFADITYNYSHLLLSELVWRIANLTDSLDALTKDLEKVKFDALNVELILPSLFKCLDLSKKERNVSTIYSLEPNDSVELLNNSISNSCLNGDYSRSKDVLDQLNGEIQLLDDDEIEQDYDSLMLTVSNWPLSNRLVRSWVKTVDWHMPLPDDDVFKAIVTSFDDNLDFFINVCSNNISKTFLELEKMLLKHYRLCNASMLNQYFNQEMEASPGSVCLCAWNSTYWRCIIMDNPVVNKNGKVQVRSLDIGDVIEVEKRNLIPVVDRFCRIPPLAVKCSLSGLKKQHYIPSVIENFKKIVSEAEYEVCVSLRLLDLRANYQHTDVHQIVVDQPLPVELFVYRSNSFVSVNKLIAPLDDDAEIIDDADDNEPASVSCVEHELTSESIENVCENKLDYSSMEDSPHKCMSDISDSLSDENNNVTLLKDVYLCQNIHNQAVFEMEHQSRPVCEYYRQKGHCFKGKKCENRHVYHSDDENEDNQNKLEWIEKAVYLDDSFERHLIIGSVIGIRVTAIYSSGLFYAYLTHDIKGFVPDLRNDSDDSNDEFDHNIGVDDGEGLDFGSVMEMEESLSAHSQYLYTSIRSKVEFVPNTLVVVRQHDKVYRGSVTQLIQDDVYQVFLLDYGISLQVPLHDLLLLPKQFISHYRKQCFMFKLSDIRVNSESDDRLFAEWFYEKVNNKVLHAKVTEKTDDELYFVELYDFLTNQCSLSLNMQVKEALSL